MFKSSPNVWYTWGLLMSSMAPFASTHWMNPLKLHYSGLNAQKGHFAVKKPIHIPYSHHISRILVGEIPINPVCLVVRPARLAGTFLTAQGPRPKWATKIFRGANKKCHDFKDKQNLHEKTWNHQCGLFLDVFFLVVGDYTRPVVAFCISSVFEGLTIFETNPDV